MNRVITTVAGKIETKTIAGRFYARFVDGVYFAERALVVAASHLGITSVDEDSEVVEENGWAIARI